MRKRYLWIAPALLFWTILVGMGTAPGPQIPVPEINYKVTVTDDQGISTKLSLVSWDGETYFSGIRGRGSVTIAFEKTRKLTSTGTHKDGKTDFQVTLLGGDVVAVSFDEDARFTGTASFGTYRIKARNIKEIVFE